MAPPAPPPAQPPDPMRVFDRAAVRRHRARAVGGPSGHDFLFREIADRLVDRLADLRRTFPLALDLGARAGALGDALAASPSVGRLVEMPLTPEEAAARPAAARVVGDEELLPFAPARFDAVLSCLALHWVNDLPGALFQIRAALRPDGLFLAAMLGGDSLRELRASLIEAEAATEGGASPRVSPFAFLRDAAALMQRAGFALPVVDSDIVTVTYPDALALMRDLRAMGESNAVRDRRRSFSRRATLFAAAARYAADHAAPDGRIPATFEVLWLTGWAPSPDQQAPLRPGSARARLADALGATEEPAGEKTDPETS